MIVFLVFLILKLTDQIDWSWWWVTSPLWIAAALAIAGAVLFGLFMLIVLLVKGRK